MKYAWLFLTIALLSLPAVGSGQDPEQGWYVRVDAGYSSAGDPEIEIPEGPLPGDLGSSSLFGGGIGSTYVPGIRTDLTLTYRSGFQQVTGFANMPSGEADFRSLVTMLTLYLDIYARPRISPYGGFGLGFARNTLGDITITNPDGSLLGTIEGKSSTAFAWQLCAGAAIQVTSKVLLDIGYRYLKAGDYESEDSLVFTDGASVPGRDRGKFRANEVAFSFQYIF